MKAVKRTCKQAPAIVVPSRFLQQECLDVLDASLDKVVVAPLGVAGIFEEPQQGIAAKPYVLTVGNTHAFRNIGRLRQALDRLKDEMPHTLVVVGQTCEAEPEDWGPRVVRVDRCPTVHLAGLYQHCDVFICPSLYEGSGVTVLEAMRAGAPVAASRVGGIPEVAGDTPVYLNPESVSAMVAAMRRLLGEGATARQRRSRFGRQLAARYTWEDCAWKTLGAFRRV